MSKILNLSVTEGTQVKFYYGKAENAKDYTDGGIYFAYDTTEIYLDGEPYCSGVNGVSYDQDNDTFTFELANGETVTITLPTASEDNDGLLSKEDKAIINNLSTTLNDLIEGLKYEDTAVTSQFVTAVSETGGIISVERAALTSEDKTVTINGYDLHVNVDGDTIIIGDDGVLSVASSALTQYVGEDAIAISEPDTDNDKTVSLVINSDDEVLSQDKEGLKTTLSIDYTESDHMINLRGINDDVISQFDATAFIVEGILEDAEIVDVNPETGATGEFLKLTWIISDGEGGFTTKTIYVDVTSLFDTYTAGNGLSLSDREFSVKIADSSEDFLTVDEAGVKLSGVQDAIDSAVAIEEARAEAVEQSLSDDISAETERAKQKETELEDAIEAAQAAATTKVEVSGDHLTISSSTASDGSTTYNIGESDIASASDLTAETERAEKAESDLLDAIDSLSNSTSETTNNIIAAVGLKEDGTHDDSIVNNYANGDTVELEIAALDTEVYDIVTNNLTWHIVD